LKFTTAVFFLGFGVDVSGPEEDLGVDIIGVEGGIGVEGLKDFADFSFNKEVKAEDSLIGGKTLGEKISFSSGDVTSVFNVVGGS
jgi:hypothetical protein